MKPEEWQIRHQTLCKDVLFWNSYDNLCVLEAEGVLWCDLSLALKYFSLGPNNTGWDLIGNFLSWGLTGSIDWFSNSQDIRARAIVITKINFKGLWLVKRNTDSGTLIEICKLTVKLDVYLLHSGIPEVRGRCTNAQNWIYFSCEILMAWTYVHSWI